MSQDPLNKDQQLRKRLDEYHVGIPDFPMKPNRWERFINFLASPAKDPLDPFISTSNGLLVLKLVPLLGTVAIVFIQMLLLL